MVRGRILEGDEEYLARVRLETNVKISQDPGYNDSWKCLRPVDTIYISL